MLLGQPGVDRPRHHLPGLMTKLLDLCKSGFPRRSRLAKTMPCQQCHQFAELLFLHRRQFQILVSSVLAHPIPETLSSVKGWFTCFCWLQWFCLRRRIGQRRGATRASPGIHELMGLPRLAGRAFFRVRLNSRLSSSSTCGPTAVNPCGPTAFRGLSKTNYPYVLGQPLATGTFRVAGRQATRPAQNGYAASNGPITCGSGRRLPGGGP